MIVEADNTTVIHFSYIRYGDVNGDGLIDILDLSLIKKHLLKSELLINEFFAAGDIYNYGDITISSLIGIKKHLLGICLIS